MKITKKEAQQRLQKDNKTRSYKMWRKLQFKKPRLYHSYVRLGFPKHNPSQMSLKEQVYAASQYQAFAHCCSSKILNVMVPSCSKERKGITVGCLHPRIFDVEMQRINKARRELYCVPRRRIEGMKQVWKVAYHFDRVTSGFPPLSSEKQWFVQRTERKFSLGHHTLTTHQKMTLERMSLRCDTQTHEITADVLWSCQRRTRNGHLLGIKESWVYSS
jgi:hypothetical protein